MKGLKTLVALNKIQVEIKNQEKESESFIQVKMKSNCFSKLVCVHDLTFFKLDLLLKLFCFQSKISPDLSVLFNASKLLETFLC